MNVTHMILTVTFIIIVSSILIIMLFLINKTQRKHQQELNAIEYGKRKKSCWGCKNIIMCRYNPNIDSPYPDYYDEIWRPYCDVTKTIRPIPESLTCNNYYETKINYLRKEPKGRIA